MRKSIHDAAIMCPHYKRSKNLYTSILGLEVVADYLILKNIAVESIRVDEYSHKKYTFFSDPDGLALELYEEGIESI